MCLVRWNLAAVGSFGMRLLLLLETERRVGGGLWCLAAGCYSALVALWQLAESLRRGVVGGAIACKSPGNSVVRLVVKPGAEVSE